MWVGLERGREGGWSLGDFLKKGRERVGFEDGERAWLVGSRKGVLFYG